MPPPKTLELIKSIMLFILLYQRPLFLTGRMDAHSNAYYWRTYLTRVCKKYLVIPKGLLLTNE